MSLKAFHVLFITLSIAMAFGCGVWGLRNHFSPDPGAFDLWLGLGGVVAGVGLIVYEIRFLKRTKGESYL
jgi:FtsH-binding integral membrane protein